MTGPLQDIHVLDLTEGIVGPYATKLLADYGADVVKVEKPEGDSARQLGPFKDGDRHLEKSGTFFYFNTNKRSVVLDLTTSDGLDSFWRLVDWADVIVEGFQPEMMGSLGISWEAIKARRSDVSLVSVSCFGANSPYANYRGSELVLYGFAGEMHSTGRLEREPVKMYGTSALVQSGSVLSTAVLGALFASQATGCGQHIDFSIADSHLLGVDRRHSTVIGHQYSGRKTLRPPTEEPRVGILVGLYQCKDGWISIMGGGPRFKNIREFFGYPEWLEDKKWDDPQTQMDPAAIEEFHSHLTPWLNQHTKREVWEAGRRARFICGPLFTVAEVYADTNFQERGLWQWAETPALGKFRFPGRPFLMSRTPWEFRRAAPELGEHTDEVLKAAGQREPQKPGRPSGNGLPLDGVRVLDLSGVWAGTFSTLLLADLGAEVIKQENQFILQPNTRILPFIHLTKEMTSVGPSWVTGLPNNDPGERPWNYHPMFVSLYRNKKSFTLDIRQSEGLEILGQLVAKSDIVLENSAVGTMEKLGISYEWLKAIKENIIYLRAPGFGLTGEYKDARAFGSNLEEVLGHQLLRGYRGSEPAENSTIFAADYIAGSQIAFALMSAVWHRNQSGEGQFIEMSQAENATAMFAQAYMAYALNGDVDKARGNRSIYATDGEVPCGAYPCKSAGSAEEGLDRWITINVTCDEDWLRLRDVMGNPPWAMSDDLLTTDGRIAKEDYIDGQLSDWTRGFLDYDLFHRLQSAGVAAAPILEASRVLSDPHVVARRLFQEQTLEDDIGTYQYPAPIYLVSGGGIRSAPVAMGQDNDYVYRELLGYGDKEIERLTNAGHIADRFADEIP
ncbi:CoA transferase [Gammaproteobacteria bacterium]|nr:CoA transferase [Gammaproteobacteria bacterium]